MKGRSLESILGRRHGTTLIEMLTYMATFGLVLSMVGPLMFDFGRANKRLTRSLEHVTETDWLSRVFRADVAKAKEIVPAYGGFSLGPTTLILKSVSTRPDALSLEPREEHVVYSLDPNRPSRLIRTALSPGRDRASTVVRVVARDLEKLEFVYGPADAPQKKIVELRLTFKKGIVHKVKPTSYSFFAVVGE
jgi:hypothetical protein